MPVYQILEEMPYHELRCWLTYFEKRPTGWREDNRTAMILQAFGVKERPEKMFQSLAVMKEQAIDAKESGKSRENKLLTLLSRSSERSPWFNDADKSKK